MTFTTPSLTAGQNYVITVTADTGSTFDAIVTVKDPNGNIIVNNQDTGTDETINFFPPDHRRLHHRRDELWRNHRSLHGQCLQRAQSATHD